MSAASQNSGESTEITLPLLNPVNPLCFGGTPRAGNGFAGDMDEIVVTQDERSAEQILNDYKFGFKPDASAAPRDDPQRRLQAVYFQKPPDIDGGLADECWRAASLAMPFYAINSHEQSPKATRAYIGYDAANVYVAFRCDEPKMEDRVAGPPGGDPFFADCVEFFVAPYGLDVPKYYQIALDYTGKSLATAYIEGTGTDRVYDATWKPPLKYAVSRAEADFWAVEMAIPIAALVREDQAQFAADWKISFCRSLMKPKLFTTWSKDSKNYHDLKQFGVLTQIGSGQSVSRSAVVKDFEIAQLNTLAPSASLIVASRVDRPLSLRIHLIAEDDQGRKTGSSQETLQLAANETKELTLPFTLDRRGPCVYRLDLTDDEQQVMLWSSGNKLVVVTSVTT